LTTLLVLIITAATTDWPTGDLVGEGISVEQAHTNVWGMDNRIDIDAIIPVEANTEELRSEKRAQQATQFTRPPSFGKRSWPMNEHE